MTAGRRSWLAVCVVAGVLGLGARPSLAHGDLHRRIQEVSRLIEAKAGQPAEQERSARLLLKRAELNGLHGDLSAARRDLQAARRLDAKLDLVDLVLGRLLLAAHQPRGARAALARFLERRPHHAEALTLQAEALVALGQPARAVELLDLALARMAQPEPDHYLARANLLVRLGPRHRDRALEGLDQGIARLGPLVSLDTRAIELEVEMGRFDRALERVARQVAATSRQDPWLARRAEILERAGRTDEARAARQQALAAIDALPPQQRFRRDTTELRQRLEPNRP
jgi:tetratricopeptide (TPR) repeat protein